jgi:TolA-binding protein
MPPELQAQLRDNQADMKALQDAIVGRQKDIEALKARFEEEKLRYRELTQKKTTNGSGAAAPGGADSRPR